MRTLTLIIPDLINTLAQADESGESLPLLRQVTQAKAEPCPPYCDEPTAFYRWLGEKGDFPRASLLAHHYKLPPAAAWVVAEPIECQANKQSIYCLGSAHLRITPHEANQCIDSLNQHLIPAGMRLYAPEPSLWLLALPAPLGQCTSPLSSVLNAPLGNTVGLFTELQMLLHKHPVNLTRERAGQPLIHACWLSGEGVLPVMKKQPKTGVITDNPLTRVLADWIEAPLCQSQNTLESTLNLYANEVNELVVCLNAQQHAFALEQNDMKKLLSNQSGKSLQRIRVYGGDNLCYDAPRKLLKKTPSL
jgi:hypothetical protein